MCSLSCPSLKLPDAYNCNEVGWFLGTRDHLVLIVQYQLAITNLFYRRWTLRCIGLYWVMLCAWLCCCRLCNLLLLLWLIRVAFCGRMRFTIVFHPLNWQRLAAVFCGLIAMLPRADQGDPPVDSSQSRNCGCRQEQSTTITKDLNQPMSLCRILLPGLRS